VVLKLVDQAVSFLRLHWVLISLVFSRKRISILLYNSDLFFNLPIHFTAKVAGIRIVKFAAEIIDKSQYRKSMLGKISRAAYMANFRYLNKMSDRLIVFSYYLKNEFIRMGFKDEKIIVQPNLTDFSFWQSSNNEIKFTVGYSGAPYLKDGLHDLLKALSILSERKPGLSIVIIGDATFGRTLIPDLREECVKLGIVDKVTFTGLVNIEEVRNYLSQCAMLAITRPDTIQTRAGFPTKLGEYFSLKKPVLATRFGDMERYFSDGIDIIYAECSDPVSIADRIELILDNSEKMTGITQRGHETAKQLLEFNTCMNRILQFLGT